MKRRPQPLPNEPRSRRLQARIAQHLPHLRQTPPPPCRYDHVTLLLYYFPQTVEAHTFDAFEFALRQTWSVLGWLRTVIVTHDASVIPAAFAQAYPIEIQVEPTLVPGEIRSMSRDCLVRLYQRFQTSHVLIVQADGWPLEDRLAAFLKYDYVGAPNVTPGWRARIADALALTVLNGGFSLRSKRLCRFVARVCGCLPKTFAPSEDQVYARFRYLFRFPSAAIARQFSEDALDGLLPPAPTAQPMGFHRASTFAMLNPEATPLTVVSVVRDWACYERCVRQNPYLRGARFVTFDNAAQNIPIPERYNAFLDAMPADTGWILFAHEDFEVQEDPRPLLNRRSTLFPCGLIGTRTILDSVILPFGVITDSDRDGARYHVNRPPLPYVGLLGARAENCDCCGFFVHADTFRSWQLRFDPRCEWDLYAEDLCFQFIQTSGHTVSILPLKAHHWSRGNPATDHFAAALAHLNAKYADAFFAGGTCVFSIGRRPTWRLRLFQFCVHHFFLRWVSFLQGIRNRRER